jgi:hypothetical protein
VQKCSTRTRARGFGPASPDDGALTKPAHSRHDLLTVRFAAAPSHLIGAIEPWLFAPAAAFSCSRGFDPGAHTTGADLKPGGLIPVWFFFRPCQARPAVDPAFQADAFGARLADSVARIWRPIAVRTFIEGRLITKTRQKPRCYLPFAFRPSSRSRAFLMARRCTHLRSRSSIGRSRRDRTFR